MQLRTTPAAPLGGRLLMATPTICLLLCRWNNLKCSSLGPSWLHSSSTEARFASTVLMSTPEFFNESFMRETISKVESRVGHHLRRCCPYITPRGALTATQLSPPKLNYSTPEFTGLGIYSVPLLCKETRALGFSGNGVSVGVPSVHINWQVRAKVKYVL